MNRKALSRKKNRRQKQKKDKKTYSRDNRKKT